MCRLWNNKMYWLIASECKIKFIVKEWIDCFDSREGCMSNNASETTGCSYTLSEGANILITYKPATPRYAKRNFFSQIYFIILYKFTQSSQWIGIHLIDKWILFLFETNHLKLMYGCTHTHMYMYVFYRERERMCSWNERERAQKSAREP